MTVVIKSTGAFSQLCTAGVANSVRRPAGTWSSWNKCNSSFYGRLPAERCTVKTCWRPQSHVGGMHQGQCVVSILLCGTLEIQVKESKAIHFAVTYYSL